VSGTGPPRDSRRWVFETGSTQDDAIAWARSEAPPRGRCVAARQRRGRGREGNSWESPEGGLYLSSILPSGGRSDPLVPMAVGASIAALLNRDLGVDVRLKWPNDLVVPVPPLPMAKLGGVLVDAVAPPAGPPGLVIGVGLNVNLRREALSPELQSRAAILAELVGRPIELRELEERVDATLRSTVESLRVPTARIEILARCRTQLSGVGQRISLDGRPSGRIVGLSDDGALQVELDGRTEEIHAGEVILLGPG
jgi:BirA family biotin operon repressor/biotin-[acetyl-CoA-carboxylase] ligase